MNKLVLLLVAFLFAVAASAASECDAVNCPYGTRCVEEPKQCITTPCPQYTCRAIRNNPCRPRTCPFGQICLPEPKQCITTPCPQYRCLTPEEYICETADCAEGTRCIPEPKQCFTTPCPQYRCEPIDMCDRMCPMYYDPVCGTDGVTYGNQCMLSIAACRDDSIAFAYKGECKESCDDIVCTKIYQPVCGTDGVTYGNLCMLNAAACKDDSILLAHEGECEKNCDDIVCTKIYQPVCGTDGVTYGNLCMLNAAACKDDSILLAHEGECAPVHPCALVNCGPNKICLADPKECITTPCDQFVCIDASLCGRMCPMIYQPVCGTDGNTYSNACMLQNASCDQAKVISVAHDGEC